MSGFFSLHNVFKVHPSCNMYMYFILYCWIAFHWTSLVTQCKESTCQCRRCGFDPWVGKIPWRKKWQPTPVFLPGQSHEQRSLEGYSPQDGKRIWCNLATKQQQNVSLYEYMLVSFIQSQADVHLVISLIREGKKTGEAVKQAQWSLRAWDT